MAVHAIRTYTRLSKTQHQGSWTGEPHLDLFYAIVVQAQRDLSCVVPVGWSPFDAVSIEQVKQDAREFIEWLYAESPRSS